jgi:hypothetical protein
MSAYESSVRRIEWHVSMYEVRNMEEVIFDS